TAVKTFAAFAGHKLSPRLHVLRRLRGSCVGPSRVDRPRPDAWQCAIGHALIDPCFVDRRARLAVCATAPWDRRVTVIRLKKAPTGKRPPLRTAQTLPWGIQTPETHCLRRAISRVTSKTDSYACLDGTYLVGRVNRRTRSWTI